MSSISSMFHKKALVWHHLCQPRAYNPPMSLKMRRGVDCKPLASKDGLTLIIIHIVSTTFDYAHADNFLFCKTDCQLNFILSFLVLNFSLRGDIFV